MKKEFEYKRELSIIISVSAVNEGELKKAKRALKARMKSMVSEANKAFKSSARLEWMNPIVLEEMKEKEKEK